MSIFCHETTVEVGRSKDARLRRSRHEETVGVEVQSVGKKYHPIMDLVAKMIG